MSNVKLKRNLGRVKQADPRDHKYLIRDHLSVSRATVATKAYWDPNGWWGDQGDTPYCVGYAWAHWIEDGPVFQGGVAPIIPPTRIYENAQRLDEWDGEDYEGTSVRGGVKYLKSINAVSAYYWAFDVDTIKKYVLNVGPIVVGTDWYDGMFQPNRAGLVRTTGAIAGGHAYVINGIDTGSKLFRIKNSWGKTWGKGGMAYISFADMAKLISQQGEACVATELKIR